MLGNAAGKPARIDQQGLKAHLENAGVTRKIWLPRVVYDALPWFYLVAGIAAILATIYIHDWFWFVPHSVLFSAACLHFSWFVFRSRRRKPNHRSFDDNT